MKLAVFFDVRALPMRLRMMMAANRLGGWVAVWNFHLDRPEWMHTETHETWEAP